MKTLQTIRWALALCMAMMLTIPALAKPGDDRDGRDDGDKSRVRIIIEKDNNQDDARVYQNWYGNQVAGYNEIDQLTGERVGDLLQLVTDVTRDSVTVADRAYGRHTVMLAPQTAIVFTKQAGNGGWDRGNGNDRGNRGNGYGRDNDRNRPNDVTRYLTPGDLVIVNGFLRSNGAFVASNIRVMGRAWGNTTSYDDYRPTYGQRGFGDISSVDFRYGRIEINTNAGKRVLYLAKGGEILVNGQKQTLQFLRRGDRIVYYYRDTNRTTIEAYRIVVMQKDDCYPEDTRPHRCDPDYRDGGNNPAPNMPMLEGRLECISTGVLFNKLTLDPNYGKSVTVYVPKTVDAVDERGNTISLLNLRQGERLQVYYTDIAGGFIAQQIRVK